MSIVITLTDSDSLGCLHSLFHITCYFRTFGGDVRNRMWDLLQAKFLSEMIWRDGGGGQKSDTLPLHKRTSTVLLLFLLFGWPTFCFS